MLQFHVTRLFGLKFKTHGVAIPQQDGIRLVFREGEAKGPRLFDKEIQSILIQWDNLTDVSVERGFFGTRLKLSIKAPDKITELPGWDDSHVELRIHRSHVDDIEPFERSVAAYRSGRVDEDVDEFIDDVRDFLDR